MILNKSYYVNNVLERLNDSSAYFSVKRDLNHSFQTKLNNILSKVNSSVDVDFELAKSLK